MLPTRCEPSKMPAIFGGIASMERIAAAALFAIAIFSVAATAAPVAEKSLAVPPSDAQTWAIVSTAGQHGQSKRWVAKDGTRWSRESLLLRGFKTEIDQQIK